MLSNWMKYLPFKFVEWYAKTQCDTVYLQEDRLHVAVVFSDTYVAYQHEEQE